VVPNVVGKTLARAKASLRSHHCRTGTVTHRASSRRLKNHVLHQSPRAGRRLANGARVNLVVGKGRHR
jgi:beta-lactam-binding protein with PASTA domain